MPIKKLHEAMTMKRLFTVYECDNGFIAEIGEAGKYGTVVGMTLSDVTAAAQTQLATAKLKQGEDEEPSEDGVANLQKRVEKIKHSQGQQAVSPQLPGAYVGGALSPKARNSMLDALFKGKP
jgi:hypothetical protein